MLKRIIYLYYRIINILRLRIKGVSFHKDCRIAGLLKLYGRTDKITIGKGFVCNADISFNPIGGSGNASVWVLKDGEVEIGNNVGISNSAIVSMSKIKLEDNVMIGGGCKIYDTDFHSIEFEQRMESPDTHIKSLPVTIKNGAFNGAHSIILKGVTIGEKSIVGAGSVVTKSIPDGEIWAGNPAKFIRRIYE